MISSFENFGEGNDYDAVIRDAKKIPELPDANAMLAAASAFMSSMATRLGDLRGYSPEMTREYTKTFSEPAHLMLLRIAADNDGMVSKDAVLSFFVTDTISQLLYAVMGIDGNDTYTLEKKERFVEYATALFDAAEALRKEVKDKRYEQSATHEIDGMRARFKTWLAERTLH